MEYDGAGAIKHRYVNGDRVGEPLVQYNSNAPVVPVSGVTCMQITKAASLRKAMIKELH